MNACTVCRHPRAASIDAELREPRANAAKVARRYRLSEQAVRRHVRNRHVEPEPIPAPVAPVGLAPWQTRPAPDAVWEFSAEEVAWFDAALESWHAAVSAATGIPAPELDAHYRALPTHDESCPTCAASDAHEGVLAAIQGAMPGPARAGRWVSRAEALVAEAREAGAGGGVVAG